MKLKNKHIVFVSLVLLFISTNNNAQEKIIKLDGIVRTDSIFLENINVINKTQNFGVSSNSKGEFIIYAALGDSILFSSVNYKNRKLNFDTIQEIINSRSIYPDEENYLKTIYHLNGNSDKEVSTNAIADSIETKASSVTDMLKKLADKDLVNYVKYQGVSLTSNHVCCWH